MSDRRPDSPLVGALSFVLQENVGLKIIDYSCAEDFGRLWHFDGIAEKKVIVVWSQTAPDPELSPISAADCLSPVDWAVCFAAQKKDRFKAWPEVLILDIDSALHDQVPSVVRLNALKPELLPWLRLEKDVRLASVMEWLAQPCPRDPTRCNEGLELFLQGMRRDLAEPKSRGSYDRHAVSNILGPMILRGQAAKLTLHSGALLQLLISCGLIGPSRMDMGHVSAKSESRPDNEDGKRTEHGNGLHVLLVDDQSSHGWADWVRESLPSADVSALSDPTALIQDVQQQLGESGSRDLRYRLTLPGMKDGAHPVLLLDLRLFSGNAGTEMVFYRDVLLPLLEHFQDRDDLAWPCFSSSNDAFVAAVAAVKNGNLIVESPEHHEALTWLPRLLSLVDLSLPIILFSSTGRRSIERAFSGYENIILGFEKPRFFESVAQSEQMATAAEAGLTRAVEGARTLLVGRRRARQALQCIRCHVGQSVSERYEHFELFIDETDAAENLVVGGLVAGFASIDDAHAFDDRLVKAGVRYFPTLAGPMPPGQPLDKKVSCRQQFEAVAKAWREEGHPLLLALVTLDGIEPFRTPLRFLDMDFMDNRWRLAVEAVVEVFLSEIVARLQQEGESHATVSIYGPTRVSPAASQSDAFMNQARFGTTVQRLDQQYGPPTWGNNAVAESNLFHTACELLRGHFMTVDLEKAKYVRLQYAPRHCLEWEVRERNIAVVLRVPREVEGDPADQYRAHLARVYRQSDEWRAGLRSLHYVCDQVLRDTVWRNDPWEAVSSQVPTFHESYDRFLRGNLAASRFLDTRRTIEAMVAWRPHTVAQPKWRRGVRQASEAIGARLASALDSVSGADFMEASNRLRGVSGLSRDVSVPSALKSPHSDRENTPHDETKAQTVEAAPRTTRYFIRLDNLPGAVTATGLLDVVRRTGQDPVGCEVADDLDDGMRVAAVYFENEASLSYVAKALRRHGWRARPFVASEGLSAASTIPSLEGAADREQELGPTRGEHAEAMAVEHCLRVGPIPNSMDVSKVTARIRQAYPQALSIRHMGSVRGGGKYLLEFTLPSETPLLEQDFIACGSERLAVEAVPTGAR